MVKSNVPLVVNSRDATNSRVGQVPAYQSTSYNANGQNLIQGAIEHISVSEVNFPYDIPNVQAGYNFFTILSFGPPTAQLAITITPGFYSGTELQEAIQAQIVIESAAQSPPVPLDEQPICSYSTSSNLFTFTAPVSVDYPEWGLISENTYPLPPALPSRLLGKDLLSIMGFANYQGIPSTPFAPGTFDPTYPLISNSAPLAFTQYIDITSPQLCQFQFLRDGSTTNLARRINVICRLYIANNVALAGPEGSRPFIINRQFQNARVMKWTSGNSIGSMDIELFDDVGKPLQITWQPRPFQITFNVHEHHDDKEKPLY